MAWLRILFVLVFQIITAAAAQDGRPAVQLRPSRVTYQGRTQRDIEHFSRIFYAHDTSGSNRFAPPKPYAPQKGAVVPAYGPDVACPQKLGGVPLFYTDMTEYSENCLSLRVARPVGTGADAKLPVVVYVHGGGFVMGSSGLAVYDPTNLVEQSVRVNRSIVYVAMNYRLGIFGFPALEELRKKKSMNLGLRDQALALQWVQKHIADFGGDPEQVTLVGQSAGATFTALHQLVDGAEKGVPFRRVWQMSGATGNLFNSTGSAPYEHTFAVAEKLGCVKKKVVNLKCLRKADTTTLLETTLEHISAFRPPDGLLTFMPAVDGDVLKDRPSVLYESGKAAKGLDLVASWAQDDGSILAIGPEPITEDSAVAALRKWLWNLTEKQMTELMSLYPVEEFQPRADAWDVSPSTYQVYQIIRDAGFTCPQIEFAYQMQRKSGANVRLFNLNQTALGPVLGSVGLGHLGVIHSADLNYAFMNPPQGRNFTSIDQSLAQQYATALIHFVATGSPEGSLISTKWPPAFSGDLATETPEQLSLQVIGGPLGHGPVALLRNESLSRSTRWQAARDAPLESQDSGFAFQMGRLFGSVQQQVFELIGTSKAKLREDEMYKERLFERCAYIRTLADTLAV